MQQKNALAAESNEDIGCQETFKQQCVVNRPIGNLYKNEDNVMNQHSASIYAETDCVTKHPLNDESNKDIGCLQACNKKDIVDSGVQYLENYENNVVEKGSSYVDVEIDSGTKHTLDQESITYYSAILKTERVHMFVVF